MRALSHALLLLFCLATAVRVDAMGRVGRHTARKAAQKVAREVAEETAERGTRQLVTRAAVPAGAIPASDLPRLTRYADAADSPATRELLMQAYGQEGPKLFERIPPSLVLAGGLSTSMILGTHRATEPAYQTGQRIQEVPVEEFTVLANNTLQTTARLLVGFICLMTVLLFWRFGLFRRRQSTPAIKQPSPER